MSPVSGIENLGLRIRQLEEAATAARHATRDARSATKDLVAVEKRIRRLLDTDIPDMVHKIVDDKIASEVQRGLDEYKDDLTRAKEAAVDRVGAMFEELGRIYMEGSSDGKPSIPELVEQHLRKIREMRRIDLRNDN